MKLINIKISKYQTTKIFIVLAFILLVAQIDYSQNSQSFKNAEPDVRIRTSLNQTWKFSQLNDDKFATPGFDDSGWSTVNLPHTWNSVDAFDDKPGFWQGTGWYRKNLELDDTLLGKRVFLYFEGANQTADIFVNGRFVGSHIGGYTAFSFDITKYLVFSSKKLKNVISVRVNNSQNETIPPSPTADFNFYGGIYRDVWLITTDPVHITTTDYASSGVFVETPNVSAEKASVKIRGSITNDSQNESRVIVRNTVLDGENKEVAATDGLLTIAAGKTEKFSQQSPEILKPNLWSPDSPYLYRVKTEIYQNGQLLDKIENPLGFRWFSFDAERGFILNGKPLKLIGANRHQDYQGLGNALPNELHVKDLEIIKQTGMNWVLLAHYPHDPEVLDAADRLGLIVWEEAPILRQIDLSATYTENSKRMVTEMIRQHYNHPSVVFWCYMNEIFLRPKAGPDYQEKTVQLARSLEELVRQEDPSRLTAISFNRPYTETDLYEESGLTQIPQVVAWHLYFGWYYGKPEDLGGFLDDYHRRHPERKILVSEYGADSDSRLHSINPIMQDYTTEWAQSYHEKYVEQMENRPYLGGFAVWNAFDFGSESRIGTVPHLNKKGIYTFDRQPKDVAFYYQAKFLNTPVLHIASDEWSKRAEFSSSDENNTAKLIKIYTNLSEVELFLNNQTLGKRKVDDSRIIVWDVPLQTGINNLEARGSGETKNLSDKAEILLINHNPELKSLNSSFTELAIDTGAATQFIDSNGTLWESDRIYTTGKWGIIKNSKTTQQKIDKGIFDTSNAPIYQTFCQSITGYSFDLADGQYEIELHFVEPFFYKKNERVFNVFANNKKVFENLDISGEASLLKALIKSFKIRANDGKGVNIRFEPVKGETILSGIRVRKIL